jgi:hypothetical protein
VACTSSPSGPPGERVGAGGGPSLAEEATIMTPVTRGAPLALTLLLAGAAFVACTSPPGADLPRIEEKTVTLEPATIPVTVGPLSGKLSGLSVVQRVNAETGAVVYAPQLRGTLTLKNGSADQAVRLLGGHVEYLDAGGAPIALARDRGETGFSFHSYSSDRLDPGGEISHGVDVPFPAAALDGTALRDIRLRITYLPSPYRQESVEVPVTVAVR